MTTPKLGYLHHGNYFGTAFTLSRHVDDDDVYFLLLELATVDGDLSHNVTIEKLEDLAVVNARYPLQAMNRITELVKAKLAEHPVEADDLLQ
jgi:hypothetical protein